MSWEKVILGNICTFVSGNAWSASKFMEKGIIPIIRIQNLGGNQNEKFVWWNDKYDSKFVVENGDLLLSLSGSIKVYVWKGRDALLNQRIVKLVPKADINKNWFFWYINNIILDIERMGKWALVNNVSITDLKDLQIPIPPLKIQKQIANILDNADALRKKDQQLLQQYDELAQSIFIDMFGDPMKNEKGWEVKKLRDVVRIENSKRIPIKQSDRDFREGIYPYYGATGIVDFIDDYKFDGEYLLIAEDGKNLLFRKKNNAFIVRGKFWVNNHAHVLGFAGLVTLSYLEFILNFYDLSPFVTGIDQFKLNKDNLERIPILLPPFTLQKHFGTIIQNLHQQKKQIKLQQKESEHLFQSLLQKAFTGELIHD